MQIVRKLLPIDGATGRPGLKIKPSSITIHWVGPYPNQTPDIVYDWWVKSKRYAGAHYVIKDELIYETIPNDEMAYHAGCVEGNRSSIGIEVIPASKAGDFSPRSINSLKFVIATIASRYGSLPLLRHYDWTKKACPAFYLDDKRWRDLVEDLLDVKSIKF